MLANDHPPYADLFPGHTEARGQNEVRRQSEAFRQNEARSQNEAGTGSEAAYLSYLEQQIEALQEAFQTSTVITADRILHQGAAWRSKRGANTPVTSHPARAHRRRSGRKVTFDSHVIVHLVSPEGHVGTLSEPVNFEPRDREGYVTRCLTRLSLKRVPGDQEVCSSSTSCSGDESGYDTDQDYDNISVTSDDVTSQTGTLSSNTTHAQEPVDFYAIFAQSENMALQNSDYVRHDVRQTEQSNAISAPENVSHTVNPPAITQLSQPCLSQHSLQDEQEADYMFLDAPQEVTSSSAGDGTLGIPSEVYSPDTTLSPELTSQIFNPESLLPPELTSPVYTFDKNATCGLCVCFSLPLGRAYNTKDIVVQTSDDTTIRVVASSVDNSVFDRYYSLPMAIETTLVSARRDGEGNLLITAPLYGGKMARG